jgi:hypothetical protein
MKINYDFLNKEFFCETLREIVKLLKHSTWFKSHSDMTMGRLPLYLAEYSPTSSLFAEI